MVFNWFQDDDDTLVLRSSDGTVVIRYTEEGAGVELQVEDINLGSDANIGILRLFPATTASGSLQLSATDSSSDVKVTITNADHAQASVYSIPDGGQATANFMISEGAQTIAGVYTFTSPVVYDHNTGITAFAGGGQGSAVALTGEFNNVTTVATDDDSVALLAAVGGEEQTVKNSGAATLSVFPLSGDSINALAVNLSVDILPGGVKKFYCIDGTVWETQEVVTLNAPSTQTGTLSLQATDNASNVEVIVTNASHAQDSTISIPDGGQATANFILSEGTSQSIDGNLVLGADASAGTLEVHPGTTNSGTLLLAAVDSSSDVAVTISNSDHGQASVVSIPDGGQATANFILSEGAATINGVKTFGSALLSGSGNGTVSGTSIVGVESGDGVYKKTVFTMTAHALTLTDSGANGGHGSQEIYEFPQGHIKVIGGHMNVTVFSAQGTGSADSGVFDIGIGTTATATDNEELATTEQDVVTKIEGTLDGSGDLSSAVNGIDSTDETFDGSTTATKLFLNAAITAATQSATEIFDVTAVCTVYWMNLGDD